MGIYDNPRRRLEAKSVAEQATEWLMALEEKGAEANPAFSDWLRESPTHVQAYLRAATLDTMLRRADPEHTLEIVKPAPGMHIPDIPSAASGNRSRTFWRGPWRMAAGLAAVGILATVSLALSQFLHNGWDNYRTAIGQQQTIQLDDGSILTMNTASRVQVRFTENTRELRLLDGEAAFRVGRDPLRPFLVRSGSSVVQAIGTEFNVYRKANETTVSVLEGRVAVLQTSTGALNDFSTAIPSAPGTTRKRPIFLDAGEEIRLSASGSLHQKPITNLEKITGWRERRLVFVDEPLGSIAYEVNRYNRAPKIRIEGAAAQWPYAVSLDANDPESLVTVLAKDPRVSVERKQGEIVIQRR